MSQPLRAVTAAVLDEQPSTAGGRWLSRAWVLTLECGHVVRRPVRFKPITTSPGRRGRVGPRDRDDILPAHTRSHCEKCPAEPDQVGLEIRATGDKRTLRRLVDLIQALEPYVVIRGPYSRVNGHTFHLTTRAQWVDLLYDRLGADRQESQP